MHARASRETDQQYRALRPRLLMCMVIGYAAFYLTRKSVNYVLPALQTDLGLDTIDPLVLAQRTRLLVGLLEYVDQHRWGHHPAD